VDEQVGGTLFCPDFQNLRLGSACEVFEIASSCSCQRGSLALAGMFILPRADTPKNRVGLPNCHEDLMSEVYGFARLSGGLNLL